MNTTNCRMIISINYRELVKSYYLIAIFYILFFNTSTFSQTLSFTIPKTTANKADLIVASGDTVILAPTSHIYGNVLIQNGGILITKGDATMNTGATIITEEFTIETGGMVSASQQGYQSGAGPGSGANAWLNYGAGGGGHGGWGGRSEAGTVAGKPYGELFQPQNLGSGGGNVDWALGGSGGGALHIIVDGSLTIQGLIMADGGYGANSNGRNGGGGAGGSIWLEAKEITGAGEIHANGGSGGSTGRGIAGGGSGGRIAIYAESNLFSGTLSASGGSGAQFGGPGTIYFEDKISNILYRKLLVDNHGHKGANAGLTSPATQIWTFDEIKLIGHGNIELMDSDDTILISGNQMSGDNTSQFYVRGKLDASSVTELKGFGFYIYEQGKLVLPPNIAVKGVNLTNYGILEGLSNLTLVSGTVPPGQVVLSAQGHTFGSDVGTYVLGSLRIEAGQSLLLNGNALTGAGVKLEASDVDILSGGLVSATAMGYASSDGPGAGFDGRLNYGGGGGGHGGIGGTSEGGVSGGPSYGEIDQPQTLGSGGGNLDPYKGGAGGGAIHFMVNGSMKIWGKVNADGENGANVNGQNSGGGAGGSIWLEASEITGTGEIHANGGAGGSTGRGVAGGGSGGRIAIQTDFLDQNIDISVAGGSGFESGNSGTISYLANIAPDDGGDYANNQITFTWVPLSGANAFRLEIATDTTELSIIDRLAVGNLLSFTYNKNLIEDVTYYARVSASKDSGLTFLPPSKFSDGITIDRTPPIVFTPTGRLLDDSRVQFVFKGADNHLLARYHIQIATDLSFQSPEIELKISADGIYTFSGTPGLTYYARAFAIDGAGNQSEYSAASNGVGLAPLPDLTVTQIQVPPSAWSGQALEVTRIVANIGPGSTNVPQWLDKVYLGADSTFDADIAALLGSRPNVSFLNPGEGYTNRAEFLLPRGMAGRYYVFIFADADDQLAESDGTNNVSRTTAPIQINLTPPPDLQITQFLTPENVSRARN